MKKQIFRVLIARHFRKGKIDTKKIDLLNFSQKAKAKIFVTFRNKKA